MQNENMTMVVGKKQTLANKLTDKNGMIKKKKDLVVLALFDHLLN